jgi:hypothetical protein
MGVQFCDHGCPNLSKFEIVGVQISGDVGFPLLIVKDLRFFLGIFSGWHLFAGSNRSLRL